MNSDGEPARDEKKGSQGCESAYSFKFIKIMGRSPDRLGISKDTEPDPHHRYSF